MDRSVLYWNVAVFFLLLALSATYSQPTFAVCTAIAESGEKARGRVLAFGLDLTIIVNDLAKDPQASKYLDNPAALREEPTLTVEARHAGTTDADEINLLVNGHIQRNAVSQDASLGGDVYSTPGRQRFKAEFSIL